MVAGKVFGAPALLNRFVRNHDGTTAIEFALIGIPFLGLLCAIFQSGLIFYATTGLQQATNMAARKILTGQVQTTTAPTNAAAFRDKYLCSQNPPILPSFIDCSSLIVDVNTATSFGVANTSGDFASAPSINSCAWNPGSIVVVRVIYPMKVFLPTIVMNGGFSALQSHDSQTSYKGNFVYMLMATATFRNEPFPNANQTNKC